MPPLFNPRLVNDPAGDPGLFVPFFYEKRALLIDAGDLSTLSARDILKITHVFITHTHMDHFIGFDRILRICLGRNKVLHTFGPEGFIEKMAARLSAYTWNLVENYQNPLRITATEIRRNELVSCIFDCSSRFVPQNYATRRLQSRTIHTEPAFSVDAAILDHDIACIGYAIKERFSVNIRKEILQEMGFAPGPWLYAFKQALYAESDPESLFEIPRQYAPKNAQTRFSLQELTDRLAVVTKGHKIAYITDAAGHAQNTEKMISLARDADHLFIEAAFLDEDRGLARRKKHLTAAAAGRIAARAGARRFTLFHFSPRYSGKRDRVEQEARNAWKTAGTGEPFNRFPSR